MMSNDEKKKINVQEIKKYWLEEALEALNVADHLYEKNDYSYSLFFGHLAIEKLLKGLFVLKKGEHAPYIHNLQRLAEMLDIKLTDDQTEKLITITRFNLESRYPDQKRSFRKKCTKEFTENELKKIKDIFKWLKSMI
ncbi:MAG: HEPN domain-containing protein [Thermodesulfobacteriota bacterium]|nr:HEPN domain-containing protein [Pseudomonadota bacterium]MCG2758896.1 HEPN domain-containing protein [Desulfobacteraceae bacterium]MEA1901129.1 HEPN domain-containing protein [Thermodesulfobacteriota bacterium]MBU4259174.1 HEPN domain-containing protein [Pseudomonadota bacterium]MBU4286956.1 HEPN domain-containing protein [Pseudomonadota bacterium]